MLDDLHASLAGATRGAACALLPGDPDRVGRLAALLDDPATLYARAPVVVTVGVLRGLPHDVPVLAASTGMGGPSTVLVAEALAAHGVRTFLRVGGAGPVADGVGHEELLVATAAVRAEGTSAGFLPPGWPAVASPDVVAALLDAAGRAGVAVRTGVLHTKDSFYGEVEPESSPVEHALRAQWTAWRRLGVLGSEMEAAALFALCTARGWRAGAAVKVNDASGPAEAKWSGDEDLCALAVAGLATLLQEVLPGSDL